MATMHEVTMSVLGFRENDEWCALALEMDLRGYGHTFKEATEDLNDSIEMQISFAQSQGKPHMIFHPAEPIYFSLFAQVRADQLSMLATGQAAVADAGRTIHGPASGTPV